MTQPEIRISLDIHEVESQTTLEIKHFDSSKILKISLTDNGLPYEISEECRAILVASKADGTYIINECSIEDNLICYPVTTQTSSAPGMVSCEVRLTGGNDNLLLTSPRFSIFVVPTVYENGGAASASKNEFDALSKLITDSENIIAEIESSLEKGDFIGEKGDKGDKGDRGDPGISPTVEVTPIDNGNRVSFTDINKVTSFDVHHGNGVNEYELNFYSDTPSESQTLIEKSVILSIINDTADHIVYINYDDGKHPASIYEYGGNIYFYFNSPNEKRWFEISYFSDSDTIYYAKMGASAGVTNMEQTATSNEDGGSNIFTFTLSDGTTSDFTVKNGSRGSTGPAGPTGEAGPAGADGLSAYEIAKNHGFDGTEEEWLESLKGEDGKDGADGVGGGSGECRLPEVAESSKVSIVPQTELGEFYFMSDYGMYGRASSSITIGLSVGDTCTVVWDTTVHTCTVVDMSALAPGALGLGNLSFAGMGGNNEPFAIGFFADGGVTFLSTTDEAEGNSHTVEIYQGTPSADEGKFLQVVDGKAAWVTIELAEDGGF
ncbi:MAG: hypothetical protein IKL36_06670 [Clostridia bacterium]|nr:hypothetical protein [Clostridia bacterium]